MWKKNWFCISFLIGLHSFCCICIPGSSDEDVKNNVIPYHNSSEIHQELSSWRKHHEVVYMSSISMVDQNRPPRKMMLERYLIGLLFIRTFNDINSNDPVISIYKRNIIPQISAQIPSDMNSFLDEQLDKIRLFQSNLKVNDEQILSTISAPLFIAINSNFRFEEPKNKIIHSLVNVANVPPERIVVFVGGSEEETMSRNFEYSDILEVFVKHNSIDFTSLISIHNLISLRYRYHDYLKTNPDINFPPFHRFDWFLLHDTCEVGPMFWSIVQEKHSLMLEVDETTFRDTGSLILPLAPEGSMNMGIYRAGVFNIPQVQLFLNLMRNDGKYDMKHGEVDEHSPNATLVETRCVSDMKNGDQCEESGEFRAGSDLSDNVSSPMTNSEKRGSGVAVYKEMGVLAEEGVFRLLGPFVNTCTSNHPLRYLKPVSIYGGVDRYRIYFQDMDLSKYKANVDFRSNLLLDP